MPATMRTECQGGAILRRCTPSRMSRCRPVTWLAIAFYLQLHDAGHWRVAEICDSEGNRIALQAPVTP